MRLFGIMLFTVVLTTLLGSAFAIGNATTSTAEDLTRWTGSTTSVGHGTQGGNITYMNITGNTLTSKWAAFYGNISGSINLTDDGSAGDNVYTWTWDASSGGAVCASVGTDFNFNNAEGEDDVVLNGVWSFGQSADNFSNTYTGANCEMNFTEANVSNASWADHQGQSTFSTCSIHDQTSPTKSDVAFCTNISDSGTNYKGDTINYELLVPTPNDGTSDTYYFYIELD